MASAVGWGGVWRGTSRFLAPPTIHRPSPLEGDRAWGMRHVSLEFGRSRGWGEPEGMSPGGQHGGGSCTYGSAAKKSETC